MKKISVILFTLFLCLVATAQKPNPIPTPVSDQKEECKRVQSYKDELLSLIDKTKTPQLKNQAMSLHLKKAVDYLDKCDLKHALIQMDAYLNIASQKKYDAFAGDKLEIAGYAMRKYMITCYKLKCKDHK